MRYATRRIWQCLTWAYGLFRRVYVPVGMIVVRPDWLSLRFFAKFVWMLENFVYLHKYQTIKLKIAMKTLIDQIAAQYEAFSTNANAQIEKNNKAAGVRARKAALELTKLLKDFRKMSVDEAKK